MIETVPPVSAKPRRSYLILSCGAAVALLVGSVFAAAREPEPRDPSVETLAGRSDVVGFTGSPGWPVSGVALSPDDKYLVTGSGDGSLWLWDLSTRRPTQLKSRVLTRRPRHEGITLDLHEHAVAFSPDSRLLAHAYRNDMYLWDVAAGKPAGGPFDRGAASGPSGLLTPDGKHLVYGSDGLPLWDVASRELVEFTRGPEFANGRGYAISPNRKLVAAISQPSPDDRRPDHHVLQLWDVATRKVVAELGRGYRDVTFSPDGKLLAAISERTINDRQHEDVLRLWDVGTHKALRTITSGVGHNSSFHYLAFSPDGKLLLVGGRDAVRFWDPVTGQPVGSPILALSGLECRDHDYYCFGSMVFSPDGATVAINTYEDGKYVVRCWDVATRLTIGEPLRGLFNPHGLAFNRSGTMLLIKDATRAWLWTIRS